MIQINKLPKNSLFSINGIVFRKGSYDRSLKGYIVYSRRPSAPEYDVACGFVPSSALVKRI
ncbi:hypothetical protein [Prevotella sp.]|uniref:hypothetical protein n=1 Tax=Prevotella sp. TaxID=59823 RepID=UPI0027E2FB24|nr:hypothetical protein [Prevotella sp.]